MASRREYEANIVGASILLSDEEILDYIYNYRFDSIRYNIFRKLKKEQKDRHVHKTLVE